MGTSTSAPIPLHVPPHLVVDFDIYRPPVASDDYHVGFKGLYEAGAPDLLWTPRYGGHWVVRRAADLQAIFADHERFSSLAGVVPREHSPPMDRRVLPIQADPPEHTIFRAMISPAFGPGAVARREAEVRRLAVGLIEQLKPKGRCEFVTEMAQHLPIRVFMGMVDLPESDRLALLQVVEPLFDVNDQDKMRVFAGLQGYLGPIVDARREKPGADLISQILQKKVEGRDITRDEALRLLTVLMIGGLDTVASMMGFIMHFLATHPEHRRRLVAEPDIIPNAVEEFLRRFAMTNPGRVVATDCEFHGVQLRQGDMVMLATPSGAIDSDRFPDAERIDFDRTVAGHTTFGNGPHRCPGAYLARTEVIVLLQEWLTRIPDFEVASDEPPVVRTGINGRFARLTLRWAA
jgi:cytochrome P450